MSLWGIGPTFVVISLLLCLPAGYVAYQYRASFTLTFAPFLFYALGAVCVAVGLYLWIGAGRRVDDYIRQGRLADKGLYGIVRHPIYAGIFLVLSGGFILSRSVILIAAALPIYLVLRLLLKREEATMVQAFGADYATYAKEVSAIFPKPRAFISAFFYPEETRQVSDQLYVIRSRDVNLYVYTDGQTHICIDTGYDDPQLPAEFARVGLHVGQIDAVLLTHSDVDHVGGLGLFEQAQLYLGREEEKLIDHTVGRFTRLYKNRRIERPYHLLDDHQTVTIGNIHIQAIATPGHTLGHTCYLVDGAPSEWPSEGDGRYLFTGDAVILQNGQVRPFYRILSMNHAQTVASAKRIKATAAHWLCTAHTGIGATQDYLR
jgi:glyoxylase-like metal-dependent hydrolase (beta-lactamase superfamily II)/protein-S-isoprenylcysteine O-methyltransferase Ste14